MQEISSFFDKFKKLITNAASEREALCGVLKEVIGVEIDPQNIIVKNGIASIPTNPVLRSELILKKRLLMEKLKENPSTARIMDVR